MLHVLDLMHEAEQDHDRDSGPKKFEITAEEFIHVAALSEHVAQLNPSVRKAIDDMDFSALKEKVVPPPPPRA